VAMSSGWGASGKLRCITWMSGNSSV